MFPVDLFVSRPPEFSKIVTPEHLQWYTNESQICQTYLVDNGSDLSTIWG